MPIDVNDAATDTINNDEASAIPNTAGNFIFTSFCVESYFSHFLCLLTATRRYGMHENFDYYTLCQQTERNKGLYTADQQVNRNDRRGTRQNPNGNRHGLECPEERDYYPWWAPSPWIDIAVLSDNAGKNVCYPSDKTCTKRCEYYMNNTMNFHKKGYCDVDHNATAATVQTKLNSQRWNQNRWYNNKAECVAANFKWYEISHADNIKLSNTSFVCAHTQYSRVNQLGNGRGDTIVSQNQAQSKGVVTSHVAENVNANRFMWTVPAIPKASQSYFSNMTKAYRACTLRMRYNISSADFQSWPLGAVDPGVARMVDSKNNSKTRTDTNSPLHQDPYVNIGPGASEAVGSMFVKLKVNTNQYARTFQDRSYVFSIKPLPTASAAPSNMADTPSVDHAAIQSAINNGGKIYNVNVRGKRGNIVQVYPSVEYDFVPNALALGTNDMVHFQWVGSDYNPRRGCNDATGGPPDLNTYSTDANANQNPRADRSNVMFTNHMGNNVPRDYMGYSAASTMPFSLKQSYSNNTVLANAPCYKPGDSKATADECYATMMRLAYLNQQTDSGSLVLRGGAKCLTQAQLDAIGNTDIADFHPLNCAKMNAKPYSYFDGGIMFMRKSGWFPYFSSRNNNFSNRQQIGIICVGANCKVDNATNVLQDVNPMNVAGNTIVANAKLEVSTCVDSASGASGANANGAHSCLPESASATVTPLSVESFATHEGDNDAKGDGNKNGCAFLTFSDSTSKTSVENNVALAFILLAVGLFFSWLAYFLYNRYMARKTAGDSKFRYATAWQTAAPVEKKARPTSINFSQNSPGVKLSRNMKGADGARPASAVKSGGGGGSKIKRTEMI